MCSFFFFFSSRRRHTRFKCDWSSDVCSSDLFRNGAPVMLTDVAKILDGVENTSQAAWMNKTPAVIVNVQRQPGGNTIRVVDSIKALLPQLESNLPKGIEVTTLTDLTTPIQASISEVYFELFLTVGLVIMVMFLFLRSLSANIIHSVAVHLSLIGTFAAMYALGYSLDNLSLMALTISTGFVVDDESGGNGEGHQGEVVEAVAEGVHGGEGADEGEWDGDARDNCRGEAS